MLATYALTSPAWSRCSWRRSSAASGPAGRSCRRFRSTPPGSGRSGRRASFSSAMLLVGARLLRLLPRRARADDRHLRRARAHARLRFLRGREAEAPPPQAIAATVVAIDGLHLVRGRVDDPGRSARPHLRPHGRHRRPGREEPRLLLRALDREPDDLPRRRGDLRARAALRRPPVRDDEGVRRRLDGLARLHRHRLLAPSLHGLRPADLGRRSSPRSPPTAR